MKFFAFVVMLAAWGCLFLAPRSTLSRIVQLLVFGLLGTVFTLAGGFAYWWDSGMRPWQKSAFILVCGVLTLASQALTMLIAVVEDEADTQWPERKRRRK